MNWQVYMILCTDNSLYTGITNNVERRLFAHASQCGAKYFRGRQPGQVVYLESGHTRSSATQREVTIKKMRRVAKDRLIASAANEAPVVREFLSGLAVSVDKALQPETR
ncbi:MAG: GIY-YIG nuclease family protein [Gammaproteobacteria bacterium]